MHVKDDLPVYEPDLYSASAVRDPYPHYAALRDLGAVVRLQRHRVSAVARYAECREVLMDPDTFASGEGVALNPVSNRLSRGTTLGSDGAEHRARRQLVAHRLTPRALRDLRDDVSRQAVQVVEDAIARSVRDGSVNGVRDLATALPMSVVPDLVGWPAEHRGDLLRWAGATIDALGPINRQSLRTAPAALGMVRFSRAIVRSRDVLPGSMGAEVLEAVDEGRICASEAQALMIDYLAPSLDTTISAISGALAIFAQHPDQWAQLRAEPGRVGGAVNEVLRFESPLRAFTRKALRDAVVGGVEVPAGTRVLVVYASANRDPREWDDPDRFDITRDAARHLAFGRGTHACAGMGLARLETESILAALLERVERIETAGVAAYAPNNVIRGLARLPLRLVPA